MFYNSKLKGSFSVIYPVSVITGLLFCLVEILIRYTMTRQGLEINLIPLISIIGMTMIYWVIGTLQFVKYKLWIYVAIGFLAGIGCLLSIFTFPDPNIFFRIIFLGNAMLIILIVIVGWSVLKAHETYELYTRRIFKLASELIDETSNGYTNRPFSAGSLEMTEEQIIGFARFMNSKYAGKLYKIENVIYLAFSLNKSVLKVSDPKEVSYVAVEKSGSVSVSVAQKDYNQYKAKFSFDQLCEGLANTVFRFAEYYKAGNENRIIDELKTAK